MTLFDPSPPNDVTFSVGYTTPASAARSSLYCSDVAKMINCPVLHVNGDCPEGNYLSHAESFAHTGDMIAGLTSFPDVSRAIEIAFKYRNHFRKDIVIDLMVYRRWHVSSINGAHANLNIDAQGSQRIGRTCVHTANYVPEDPVTEKRASTLRRQTGGACDFSFEHVCARGVVFY